LGVATEFATDFRQICRGQLL